MLYFQKTFPAIFMVVHVPMRCHMIQVRKSRKIILPLAK